MADFGISRAVPELAAATHVTSAAGMGTHGYTAPEVQRFGLFGPKSDTFALGVVMLQLATARYAPQHRECIFAMRHVFGWAVRHWLLEFGVA